MLTNVDLTNCDREPIHQLGAIQPFGFLLAVSPDWLVMRASANLAAFVDVAHDEALGRSAADILGGEAVHAIRNRLAVMRGAVMIERLFSVPVGPRAGLFDIAVHLSSGQIVIEAEPSQPEMPTSAASIVRGMMSRLDQATTTEAFLREGARQVRGLTGFDRVMVYRFAEDGSGEVVAEAARPGIGSFLGLHYPATDIPAQARALYLRNLFRIIADVRAEPVGIVPALDERGEPLDLSMSILRAVSSIHIEYLRNMGVEASLSISIVVEGRLWGLFACHHYAPLLPSFERRSIVELFGQLFASQLEGRERRVAAEFEAEGRRIADRIVASVADDASLLGDPAWLADALGETIACDGIGVWIDGQMTVSGLSPSLERFAGLVGALNRTAHGRVFATDHLSEFLRDEDDADDAVAGILAIPISRSPRDYVVLFRQEMVRTVRWAGDPSKPVEHGPNGPRLTPRKSFESWSELVRGRSHPFTAAEQRLAEAVRIGLIEVVLRLTDDTNRVRQQASERQELLIAELNHRVRNILSLIRGLVRQTRASATDVGAYVGELEGRIQSLARAHDQITRDHWAPAPLRSLIEAESAAYLGPKASRLSLEGPAVLLAPDAFSTAALVLHELVTNSAKYGSLSDSGTVRVTWRQEPGGDLRIDWLERDGPEVRPPTRQGFGTTIITRSIPFDLKGEAELHYDREGLRGSFRIPARYVTAEPASRQAAHAPAAPSPAASAGQRPLEGLAVLLVEDSLIIAMDAEDILLGLGAARVDVTTSQAETRAFLGDNAVDLVLLDVNLGDQTSFPIADELARREIPFVFATGYGEAAVLPEGHRRRVILQKPYTAETIAAKCGEALGGGA